MSLLFTIQTIIEIIIACSILYCIAFEDKALSCVNKFLGYIFKKDKTSTEQSKKPIDTVKNKRKNTQYHSTENVA